MRNKPGKQHRRAPGQEEKKKKKTSDMRLEPRTLIDVLRGGAGSVIVEGFVAFDYEITLMTVRHAAGTAFLAPIGHRQVKSTLNNFSALIFRLGFLRDVFASLREQ
jgi:hypothetical protein